MKYIVFNADCDNLNEFKTLALATKFIEDEIDKDYLGEIKVYKVTDEFTVKSKAIELVSINKPKKKRGRPKKK